MLQVRVVEFNETTSFRQQLEAITTSGVFISVHTSNLANSQFLRPGSAVFEIIQRNWAYHGLDKSFQVPRMACPVPLVNCLPFSRVNGSLNPVPMPYHPNDHQALDP